MGQTLIGYGAQVRADHCSAEEIAAYLDNGLGLDERSDVEAHLASCADCRSDLVAAKRVIVLHDHGSRGAARQRRMAAVALALAAGLLIVLVPLSRRSAVSSDGSGMRSAAGPGLALRALSPGIDTRVAAPVRFVWSDAGDATYRIVVTDSAGATLWSGSTRDTSIALVGQPRLVGDRRYYWSVDALKSDGSSVTSGVIPFSVRE